MRQKGEPDDDDNNIFHEYLRDVQRHDERHVYVYGYENRDYV